MAASGYTPISLYYSTTAAAAPVAGNLTNGELAINITDGKLYYKDNTGTVKVIAGAGGAGIAGGSNTQVQYNSSGSLAGSSNMTFDGTTLTVNGLATTGTVTVGDASGDALTINSSAVSIPNGLNFDSNTFVIDATNNRVGVGTASPASGYSLEVSGSGIRNTATNPYIDLYASGQATDSKWWRTGGGGANFTITAINDAGTGSDTALTITRSSQLIDSIRFSTNSSERMRITSTGNVGIGTSSPSYKLDVAGLVASQDAYLLTANSSGTPSAGAFIFRPASNTIALGTNSAERMRLDSSGNLLLGTTAQYNGGKFEMAGTSSDFVSTRFVNAAGGSNIYLQHSRGASVGTNTILQAGDPIGTILFAGADGTGYSNAAYIQGSVDGTPGATADMPGRLGFFTSADGSATPTERMRIDSSGNVGIGTSSPSEMLTVAGGIGSRVNTNANSNILIINSSTGSSASARFRLASDVVVGNLQANSSTNTPQLALVCETAHPLTFLTNNTERMRLDSSGNLGLGVTPSTWNSVYRAIQLPFGASLTGRTDTAETLLASNTYRDSGGFRYFGTGNATSYFQTSGQHIWQTAASGTAGNAITFTQAMTLDASGNLGIGTSSPKSNSGYTTLTLNNASNGGVLEFTNNGTTINQIYNDASGAYIATASGKYLQLNAAGSTYISASTNGSERMRIDSSGNVGIGTIAPGAKLDVQTAYDRGFWIEGSASSTVYARATQGGTSTNLRYLGFKGEALVFETGASTGTTTTEKARISTAGGFSVGTTADPGAGAIYATGNITAYYSDDRLKTKLGGINNALDKVKSLSGFYYEANQTAQDLGYKVKREVGVSAQQVQAVLPEVVSPAPIDQQYLTVDYERIVPLLIEAIKELEAKVEALGAK